MRYTGIMVRTATSKEIAAELGVTATTVRKYALAGRLPCDRTPGGHRRYDIEEAKAALGVNSQAAHSVSPVDPSALDQYRGRVVAVDNGSIIAVGDSLTEVWRRLDNDSKRAELAFRVPNESHRRDLSPGSAWLT